MDAEQPVVAGARLGREPDGRPAWFVPNPEQAGQVHEGRRMTMAVSQQRRSLAQDAVDYDPFAGGELLRVVPTTEPQREVWLADQLGNDASLAFNESVSLRLRGALDVDALQAALHALVERHDVLRASFGPDGETLCVLRSAGFALQRFDLASLGDSARAAAIDERLRLAVETPFALEQRLAVPRRTAATGRRRPPAGPHRAPHRLRWLVVVGDGARTRRCCTRSGRGAADEALPPPQSFADYALAEAVHPADKVYAEDEAYWLSRFGVEAPVLDLPVDRPRPAQRSFASKREDYVLDAALVGAIRAMGARRGVSLFATLLAGFASLLSRLAAQSDVVIGIPAAGQSVDGHDQLVGHCVNLLPLRFDVDAGADRSPMRSTKSQTTLLDAIEHQRYTFGTLLKKLRVKRDPARMPLVSVMFNIDQALDQQSTSFPGLSLDFASNARSFENFELFINAVQAHGELRLECQYNTDLFDAATVRRWMQAYECLLRSAVQGVGRRRSAACRSSGATRCRRCRRCSRAPTPFAADARHARIVRDPVRPHAGPHRAALQGPGADLRAARRARQPHRRAAARARRAAPARWSAWRWIAASTCSRRCSASSRPAPATCRWIPRSRRNA